MNRYKRLCSLILAGVLMGTGIATARHSATGRGRPWFAGARRTPYSRIISIGDSLSDLGNLFALTGGDKPAPPYYEGRFSNGPLWVEILAARLRMVLVPEDQYAVAGAYTGPGNLNGAYPGMEDQVLQLLDNHPQGLDPNALYTIWIGANDFFATLEVVALMDPSDPAYQQNVAQAFLSMVATGVANTADAVSVLAAAGARHILVVNLPDLGITPMGTGLGPGMGPFLSFWVDTYNGALDQALDALATAGVATIRLDSAGLLRDMVSEPARFGLVNVTDQGVYAPDPAGYLFWDPVHPTTEGHEVLADRAVHELLKFYARKRAPRSPRALLGHIKRR